jgi:hypothetical protein
MNTDPTLKNQFMEEDKNIYIYIHIYIYMHLCVYMHIS